MHAPAAALQLRLSKLTERRRCWERCRKLFAGPAVQVSGLDGANASAAG